MIYDVGFGGFRWVFGRKEFEQRYHEISSALITFLLLSTPLHSPSEFLQTKPYRHPPAHLLIAHLVDHPVTPLPRCITLRSQVAVVGSLG